LKKTPPPGGVFICENKKKNGPLGPFFHVLDKTIGGRSAFWQRYEEATMCQCRPTDPMDPGDAADLSIMGRRQDDPASPLADVLLSL